ncbi:hypothetical protein BDF19DRAFT_462345 [Syncephalis fuscata]|nr:hypothetical protein BDF19DRAFT_462345 [Syncephalis fuscata]
MGYKNNDPESPFTIYGIQFTDISYQVKGVHYIKGTQHSQPITLACGSDPNPNNPAFQVYKDLILNPQLSKNNEFSIAMPELSFIFPGQNRCYVLPGLIAIEEEGWHAQMNFKDICITKKKNGKYIPHFFYFNNAISAKKKIDYETDIISFSLNPATLDAILWLVNEEKSFVQCELASF